VVNRYTSITTLKALLAATTIYCGLYMVCLSFFQLPTVPRSVALFQPMIFLFLVCSLRVLVGTFELSSRSAPSRRILLYGAGGAGSEVISALAFSDRDKIIALIDDDKKKQGRKLLGISIFGPHEIGRFISKFAVTDILLAMPSISKLTRSGIFDNLLEFNVRVRSIPTMSELLSNNKEFARFIPLDPEEFLPRNQSQNKSQLLGLHGKTVLVTGAGGSIGDQICCMVVEQKINTLILVEHSEFNLYKIQVDLEALLKQRKLTVNLFSVLADVCDEQGLQRIFKTFKP
jgi:FlaA1/EpsC-like NDP-sugar epimerase